MTDPNRLQQFRRRNQAYYQDLERLHQLLVAPGLRVLEIGCGLGDLLAQLQPSHGVGIELDPDLAAAAQLRHPELRILAADAETITPAAIGEPEPFDVILLPNTLNTLQDVQGVLERLEAFCHPR
ncbi:MAG: class I SAM-dependent methyltransferase, partial [Synechococcaceae bacterium WB9_4xB_025]|nr:class I SAM-dependent methyltransferase [Synechococcaceae bacterium WB9_4xB_025]